MLTLTPDELQAITGYTQPAKQLHALQKRGYWRAFRSRLGQVVLERAHYEAVCAGIDRAPVDARPRLRLEKA